MRRYIGALLVAIVCLFCMTGNIEAAQKGDINGDGRVDDTDLNIIKQYLIEVREFTPYEQSLADVDGDGQVTINDMVRVLQISQGERVADGDIRGDVNSDGCLDKTDATTLLSYIQGKQQLTTRGMAVADANKDGNINILDCVWILNVVTGKEIYPVKVANINSGWYKIVPLRDQSKAVKVSVDPSITFANENQKLAGYAGKPLSLDTYADKDYQKFYISSVNGAYTMSAGNSGLNLFTREGSNEAVLAQYAGEWIFIQSGDAIYIASKTNKGMVLEYSGGNTAEGTLIEVNSISNVDRQRWLLVSVQPPFVDNYVVATPCQNLLLRSEANNKCEILAKMPKGSVVKVLSIEGDWARVEFNGQQGYAFVKFLQKK